MSRKRVSNRRRLSLESLEDRTLLSTVNFSAPASYAVGTNPNSVVVGDFNGDGKPDLAVAGDASSVSVLLGNGDGTFQTAQNFAAGAFPNSLAVGDFNGDGKLDLALTNAKQWHCQRAAGQRRRQLSGSPRASPRTGNRLLRGGGGLQRDGKLDLTVANSSGVSVLLGNGDGSFQAAQDFAVGGDPDSVAVADFNGDGKPDLAVATSDGNARQRAAGQRRRQLPDCPELRRRGRSYLRGGRRTSTATASPTWPWRIS